MTSCVVVVEARSNPSRVSDESSRGPYTPVSDRVKRGSAARTASPHPATSHVSRRREASPVKPSDRLGWFKHLANGDTRGMVDSLRGRVGANLDSVTTVKPRQPEQRPAVRRPFVADEYSTGRARALRAKALGAPANARPVDPPTSARPAGSPDAAERQQASRASGFSGLPLPKLKATEKFGFSDKLKLAKGVGVSFGVSAQATEVAEKKTEKGVTTYSVKTDASVTLKAGVTISSAGVTVAQSEGLRVEYKVSMPEAAAAGVNPASVNPFDPSSMPTGATVTLDGSNYSSNEFTATFRNLSVQTKVTELEGVSVAVQKVDDHTVRVTAGPTAAIEAYAGVGLDLKVASLKFGRADTVKGATLKSAEFDLSTPEGQAAYNHFLASGELPETNGPGVTNAKTLEKLDASSQAKIGLKLGPLDFTIDGTKNTGAMVVTTNADGTKTISQDYVYGDNPPLRITSSYDAQGNELESERRYELTITADAATTQLLNVAMTGDLSQAETGPVKEGSKVRVSFTKEQLAHYREQVQAQAVPGTPPLPTDPDEFAASLVRRTDTSSSHFGNVDRLYRAADEGNGSRDDGAYRPIDATFTVEA